MINKWTEANTLQAEGRMKRHGEVWIVSYIHNDKTYTFSFDSLMRAQIYYWECQAIGHEPTIHSQVMH